MSSTTWAMVNTPRQPDYTYGTNVDHVEEEEEIIEEEFFTEEELEAIDDREVQVEPMRSGLLEELRVIHSGMDNLNPDSRPPDQGPYGPDGVYFIVTHGSGALIGSVSKEDAALAIKCGMLLVRRPTGNRRHIISSYFDYRSHGWKSFEEGYPTEDQTII